MSETFHKAGTEFSQRSSSSSSSLPNMFFASSSASSSSSSDDGVGVLSFSGLLFSSVSAKLMAV